MTSAIRLGLALALGLPLFGPAPAVAQSARITKLTDVAFGTVSNFSSDLTIPKNICVFSNATSRRYRVTATGSGTGGAFTLASGARTLAYEVQWSATSRQSSGSPLTSGTPLTGLTSNATQQACSSGPATSASLITIIRSASINSATAGSYSGTLTLVVAPN